VSSDALRHRYASHEWTRVPHAGSGDEVWRLAGRPDLYVKIGAGAGDADRLTGEADRLTWLRAQGIPAAEVVDAGPSWLVTRAVAGEPASAPWPERDRAAVVDALADITRRVHDLPVETCPFDRTLTRSLAAARDAAARDRIDLGDLDDERAGWTPGQLVTELEATAPTFEELVVCHGDLSLPNLIVDPRSLQVTGLIDTGRLGVADRYADLALINRSLGDDSRNAQFGPQYAARFLAAYGETDPDPQRLAFYRLLDEFC
jgi:kanamycin kinase